ncbi:hypothetical protein FOL47_000396 [Perkinsus chesapeaki]|uniref:Uncharacterized protein n=1 Tax=Perkinsus chesapeaki TaxID=330153 RepID=A0A7J6MNL5_PERCH|nr:hypothetical protein FOL47_000396 [Perkinsus chesapeaki]
MIEGANRPPADKEPAELGRPSLDEPIAVTQPLQPSDVALPTMALTVGDPDNIMSAGGGSCAATIASLSDFPPELKINGKEELLPRPQAYQDTAWMKFAANNDQEQDKTERVPRTSDSEEDDEDYEPTAPVRDSSSSSEGSSAEDSVNHQNTPLTRSEKRRRKAGYKKQTSPPKRRGHDAPRPRLSLVDQGIIIDSFNTELGDIYAVEVKPAAKTPRYIRWFDRKSSDPDLAGPAIAEMKRAEMPLHRKIFFLLEQRLPDRELPQAPLDLLAAAFGRAKLGDLESDAVIAWIATQDPAKMTHRVCAAAVIGCGGRRSPGHSPNFIIRLFTTSRDVSFGRRKVRVRGNGWGKLLLQEIEHHLVAARNCPYLLVESVAEAWGFWSHLGFELKSSRTTATSSSDTEGCEFDTMRIGVYAQTLIGAKPVRSFRRV